MPYKPCNTCGSTGRIADTFSSKTTYSYCYTCAGSGQVHYDEPIRSTPNKQLTSKSAPLTKVKKTSNTNSLQVLLGIAGAIGGYFLSVMYVTESLIISGAIGLITFFIFYKWHKKILIISIAAGLIYFFFLRDK